MKRIDAVIAIAAGIVLCSFQQHTTSRGEANNKTTNSTQADPERKKATSPAPNPTSKTDTYPQGVKSGGSENIQIVTPTPEKPIDLVERIIGIVGVICTLILAGVGIKGIFVALGTIREMKTQGAQMGRQVEAGLLQVNAMQGQITEMSIQSDILRQSVAVARDAASAAKTSADIVARVSLPTLKVEKFGFGYIGAAIMDAVLQFPDVEMVVKNYGQTPAFLWSWTIVFTCEELPDLPAYGGYPGSGITLEKQVIDPGGVYTLPRIEAFRRQRFSDSDIKAILDREKSFVAYGFVAYTDLFRSPLKRFKFCEAILNIGDTWAQWTELLSDPPYVGTDDYPIKKTSSAKEAESQPVDIDGKKKDYS
jgi:hypothetical protein